MLSSEIAALAGVTVRTLRHYHQIGLLPEPPRTAGGYRHYDVGHLVRLLRITRMTALGIQLSVLPAIMDDPTSDRTLVRPGRRHPDDEVATLIGDLVTRLRPVLARLADLPPVDAQAAALMDELSEQMLRPAQRSVLHPRPAAADPARRGVTNVREHRSAHHGVL